MGGRGRGEPALTGSHLLSEVTDLADFLPDRAGALMFREGADHAHDLTAVKGGAVVLAWVAAVGVVAGPFRRRDA